MDKKNKPSFFLGKTSSALEFPLESKGDASSVDSLTRSNLFKAAKKVNSDPMEIRKLEAQKPYIITHEGCGLNQSHLSVWLVLKEYFIGKRVGEKIRLSGDEILKTLGKSRGGANSEWIRRKIIDLATAILFIREGNKETVVRLVKGLTIIDHSCFFDITMDEELASLFRPGDYTQINLDTRLGLRSDIAKWLYSYWASHKNLYPIKEETIKKLCGNDLNSQSNWRINLRKALKELVKINYLKSFSFSREGLVTPLR